MVLENYSLLNLMYPLLVKRLCLGAGWFLNEILDKIGFKYQILICKDLPKPQSNRGYQLSTIFEAFISSIWWGANRFMHTFLGQYQSFLKPLERALGDLLLYLMLL